MKAPPDLTRDDVERWQAENIGYKLDDEGKPTAELDYGYICDVCCLSDWGYRRLISNGFDPKPCRHCEDYFKQKGL